MNSPDTPNLEINLARASSPQTSELPTPLENADGMQMFYPTIAPAPEDANKNRSGLRLMRTSPLILFSCGVAFISLIFLLDFTAQTNTHADQTEVSQAASNEPAKNLTKSDPAREESIQASTPVATPQPSVAPTPVTAEAASAAAPTENVEMAGPTSAPAPTLQANGETKAPIAAQKPVASEGAYTLQVGSFNNQSEASERVEKLGALGVQAYVVRVEIPKRGTWYRVQTGSFNNREEAARYGTQIRNKGAVPDFIITERRAT